MAIKVKSFDFCLNAFEMRKKIEKRSIKTIKGYMEELLRFKNYLLKNNTNLDNIENIDKDVIIEYLYYLTYKKVKWDDHPTNSSTQIGLTPTSINNTKRFLSVFFNFLLNEDWIKESPIKNIKSQPYDKNNIKVLTKEQIEKLLEQPNKHTFPGFRDFVLMLIILDNGIRVKELFEIKINNIDFDNKYIKISDSIAKTNKFRFCPISNKTINHIKELIHYCRLEYNDPLVINHFGEKLTTGTFSRNMTKYGNVINDINFNCTPHVLRHTFATQYLLNGGDVFSLQRILGHSTLDMVKKYVHFNDLNVCLFHNQFSPIQSENYAYRNNTDINNKNNKLKNIKPKRKVIFNAK